VTWSGNTVAEGSLTASKPGLDLALRVSDTDVQVDRKVPWDGSSVEIFFAPDKALTDMPVQVVVLPDPKNPALFIAQGGRKIPGGRVTVRADCGGYDLQIRIPWKAARIVAGKPFLMEILVRANALGDAHGRVNGVWNSSQKPHIETANYALVVP
jgi:hypothetical protein